MSLFCSGFIFLTQYRVSPASMITGRYSLFEHNTNLAKKVEQHLVHDNEQLSGPIGIELAPEILVGECHVIPEYGFQEIKERTLARVPLFRYQQEYGEFLQRLQEQQLQIVQSQIVLFPENV